MIVGRDTELHRLRELVTDLAAGRGRVAWVEGEPGIGKSALLAEGLRGAESAGCQLLWGTADELGHRLPLRVVLDALGIDTRSRDPRRADVAQFLDAPASGAVAGFHTDPIPAAIERLLTLIDQLCADSPVALVLDDLQWADEASLVFWQRLSLAVQQVPLLLVGAARPVPRRAELGALRQRLREPDAVILRLEALTSDQCELLAAQIIGAVPGSGLRAGLARAAGNPLYVTEIVHALISESGADDLQHTTEEGLPESLTDAIATRFGFLSEPTTDLLRVASLLGTEFTVTDLTIVAEQPARAMVPLIEEAAAARVLTEGGLRLRFRHPLFRETLYRRMPHSLRDALHLQAAHTLADANSPVDRIAHQLLLVTELDDAWARDWLTAHAADLIYRMPTLAWELLTHAALDSRAADPRRETLDTHIAAVAFLLARYDDVLRITHHLLASTTDPDHAGQATWLLAYALMRLARYDQALAAIDETIRRDVTGESWNQRLRALQAILWMQLSRYADTTEIVDNLFGEHPESVERIAAGYALHARSMIQLRVQRDRHAAVATIDEALSVIEGDAGALDLRVLLLINRTDSLLELDRMDDAEATLQLARQLVEGTGMARLEHVRLLAAEAFYTVGRWDDSQAELDSIVDTPDTRFDPLATGGVEALIAGHRDDRPRLGRLVATFTDQDLFAPDMRSNAIRMIMARALLAERDGDPSRALAGLLPLIDDEHALGMDESYLALPDLTRLAVAVGATTVVVEAARAAADWGSSSSTAHGRAIAAHCHALVEGDAELLIGTIDSYFRQVRRPFELAHALEDAAVLLAEHGAPDRARSCVNEAVDLYTGLAAAWDIRRAQTRLRQLGVRRGARGTRHRAATGWDALTPTERTVARLVAQGRSNPDIATELFLSRSTVQTHVSHVLAKLGLHSRGQVAVLALNQSTELAAT